MQDFKADILAPNKKGRLYFYLSVAMVMIVIVVLIFLQIIPIVLQVFSIALWLFAISKYILQSRKQVLKKIVGELIISDDRISIFDYNYNLDEITLVKISVSGWRSYKRSSDRHQPISDLHNGDENFLSVIVKDKTIKCEFLLTSEEHWQLLRQHVLNWYCLNINISEAGTYGLQNLTYKEIQEFKKQLHISKISAS